MKITSVLRNLFFLLLPTFIIAVIVLELFFRFIIPACQSPYYSYDVKYNIMKMATEPTRDGVTTAGPLAQVRATWHINNDGWNSHIDYMEKSDRPVIAILGASLIEALHVNINESVSAKLQEMLMGKYYVYNFGISGGVLSNMLYTARYANEKYDPKVLVLNITPGTILPSSCETNNFPGMCLKRSANGFSEIVTPYTPKSTYRFLRRSATLRYLYQNIRIGKLIQLPQLPRFLHAAENNNKQEAVQASSKGTEQIKTTEENIIDYIFRNLKDENPDRVMIVMYSSSSLEKKTYNSNVLQHESAVIKNKCSKYGLYFIDMDKELTNIEKTSGKRIDFGFDDHWNAFGHESVAKKLYSELTNNILKERK